MSETRIAVIGGGIAGLSIAEAIVRLAKQRGLAPQVVVLEAAAACGGKIGTRIESGFTVELGPHGFEDREPAMKSLVERLGLAPKLLRADAETSRRMFIVHRGQLVPVPTTPQGFATSKLMPMSARLRVMGEPMIPARAPGLPEESILDFVSRRMGGGAADLLVDSFVIGAYAGDARRLSATAAFPKLVEHEQLHGSLMRGQQAAAKEHKRSGSTQNGDALSFEGGMVQLIEALVAKLEVRTNFRAERLLKQGDRFRIEGTKDAIDADAVVLTTPAYDSAALLRPLAEDAAKKLDEIPYVKLAVVVLGFDRRALPREIEGLGFMCPESEGLKMLASLYVSLLFPRHAPAGMFMVRTTVGGRRHPEHADGSDAELIGRVRGELASLLGLPRSQPVALQTVIRWDRALPQYELGHAARVGAAGDIERRFPGIVLGGNALRGVRVNQCVAEAEQLATRALERIATAAR